MTLQGKFNRLTELARRRFRDELVEAGLLVPMV